MLPFNHGRVQVASPLTSFYMRRGKRIIDLSVAAGMLVVGSPLMVAVAAAV